MDGRPVAALHYSLQGLCGDRGRGVQLSALVAAAVACTQLHMPQAALYFAGQVRSSYCTVEGVFVFDSALARSDLHSTVTIDDASIFCCQTAMSSMHCAMRPGKCMALTAKLVLSLDLIALCLRAYEEMCRLVRRIYAAKCAACVPPICATWQHVIWHGRGHRCSEASILVALLLACVLLQSLICTMPAMQMTEASAEFHKFLASPHPIFDIMPAAAILRLCEQSHCAFDDSDLDHRSRTNAAAAVLLAASVAPLWPRIAADTTDATWTRVHPKPNSSWWATRALNQMDDRIDCCWRCGGEDDYAGIIMLSELKRRLCICRRKKRSLKVFGDRNVATMADVDALIWSRSQSALELPVRTPSCQSRNLACPQCFPLP